MSQHTELKPGDKLEGCHRCKSTSFGILGNYIICHRGHLLWEVSDELIQKVREVQKAPLFHVSEE